MADVELVIKIDEETLQDLYNSRYVSPHIKEALRKGTQLPKGHGRIGDLDALEQEILNGIKAGNYEDGYDNYSHINNIDDCVDCVRYADAIIEAEKE